MNNKIGKVVIIKHSACKAYQTKTIIFKIDYFQHYKTTAGGYYVGSQYKIKDGVETFSERETLDAEGLEKALKDGSAKFM